MVGFCIEARRPRGCLSEILFALSGFNFTILISKSKCRQMNDHLGTVMIGREERFATIELADVRLVIPYWSPLSKRQPSAFSFLFGARDSGSRIVQEFAQ
jgi:hypothetical protein